MLSQLSHNDLTVLDFLKQADNSTIYTGKDENGVSYLKHLFRIYELLYGEVCTGCPSKIQGYINRIKNQKVMSKNEKKTESLYQLKKGVIITLRGTSKAYSEHNITDKIAKKLLQENPNRKSLFSVLPDDWEQDDDSDNTVIIFNKEFTVEEAKVFLAGIGVNSNATTVKGIEKKLNALSKEQIGHLNVLIEG